MVTAEQCLKKWGIPSSGSRYLVLWTPDDLYRRGAIPARVYCNRDLVKPLRQAFTNLITRGCIDELKSWDGCFNIRQQRGGSSWSLHSWAIAVDVNAKENPLGQTPVLSPEFVKCFTDAGFDWGGKWKKPDGMHFQLAKI
jgi:hypothetical protein